MKFSKLKALVVAGLLAFNVCTMNVMASDKITFGYFQVYKINNAQTWVVRDVL